MPCRSVLNALKLGVRNVYDAHACSVESVRGHWRKLFGHHSPIQIALQARVQHEHNKTKQNIPPHALLLMLKHRAKANQQNDETIGAVDV
jgi:hypothetical protein